MSNLDFGLGKLGLNVNEIFGLVEESVFCELERFCLDFELLLGKLQILDFLPSLEPFKSGNWVGLMPCFIVLTTFSVALSDGITFVALDVERLTVKTVESAVLL